LKHKAACFRALGNLGEAQQKTRQPACFFVRFRVAFRNHQIHRNPGSSHVEVSNNHASDTAKRSAIKLSNLNHRAAFAVPLNLGVRCRYKHKDRP
jgi:hypothetical protein